MAVASIALVAGTQAATISFNSVNATTDGSVSEGTLGVAVGANAPTVDVTYSITDLNIEGDLVADDTLTAVIRVSTTGSTQQNVFTTFGGGFGGSFGESSGNNALNGNEALTFSFVSASFAYGSGNTTVLDTRFDGFTQVTVAGSVTYTLTDVAADPDIVQVLQTGVTPFTATQSFEVSAPSDPTRVDGLTFSITAVPEPSSTALLGLGGLALILRRRK